LTPITGGGKKVWFHRNGLERVIGASEVFVNLNRETIKESPEYTEESLLTRDYETPASPYLAKATGDELVAV